MALLQVAGHERPEPLDEAERRRHKRRNLQHSALLLGGMLAIAGLSGWLLFGPDGMVGLLLGMVVALMIAPRVSPTMVLRMHRARRLGPAEAPELVRMIKVLAARAGLERPPALFYVPSRLPNAFAVGNPDDAVIAVTDGLLRTLAPRELLGVLAHETSHVRNNDLWLMSLADMIGRMTRLMSVFGIVLIVIGLPMWLAAGTGPPILLIPLLLFAPQITLLLQLAFSRAREFEADLDAVGLTGDPDGLASALVRLERSGRGLLERIFMPDWRLPEPSLLRTHPPTRERVERLRALAGAAPKLAPIRPKPVVTAWPEARHAPRARLIGYFH